MILANAPKNEGTIKDRHTSESRGAIFLIFGLFFTGRMVQMGVVQISTARSRQPGFLFSLKSTPVRACNSRRWNRAGRWQGAGANRGPGHTGRTAQCMCPLSEGGGAPMREATLWAGAWVAWAAG